MSEVYPVRNKVHSQAQVANLAMILGLFLASKQPGGQRPASFKASIYP
jgi:hypothetical protein